MSTNKYKWHLHVLVEDDANDKIVNGFLLNLDLNESVIQVLRVAKGWPDVVKKFKKEIVRQMKNYHERRIVLIIDFDNEIERLNDVKSQIPEELSERVFVLGALSNPEALKVNLGKSLEAIGASLSQDCSDNTQKVWGHDLLKHNEPELNRMVSLVKPFLFKGTDQRYS